MTLDTQNTSQKEPEITKENFLSFSVEQYEQMPVNQLLKAAQFAGLDDATAFLLLMQRGKAKGKEAEERQKQDRESRESVRQKFHNIPPQARLTLHAMQISDVEVERAHQLEKEAYELFGEKDNQSKSKFKESQRLIIDRRFADFCMGSTLSSALEIVKREKREQMPSINIPYLRDAIEAELSRLERWVHTIDSSEAHAKSRWNRGANGPYGPAEVFEIDTQRRSPVNPRSPHRQNDELKGY